MTVVEMGMEKSPFPIFWTATSLQIQIWSSNASEHSLILCHGLLTCSILLNCNGIWTVLTCPWCHLHSSGRCVGPRGDSELCVWVLASQIPCSHLPGSCRDRPDHTVHLLPHLPMPLHLVVCLNTWAVLLVAMLALHRKAMSQQQIISWPHILNQAHKPNPQSSPDISRYTFYETSGTSERLLSRPYPVCFLINNFIYFAHATLKRQNVILAEEKVVCFFFHLMLTTGVCAGCQKLLVAWDIVQPHAACIVLSTSMYPVDFTSGFGLYKVSSALMQISASNPSRPQFVLRSQQLEQDFKKQVSFSMSCPSLLV